MLGSGCPAATLKFSAGERCRQTGFRCSFADWQQLLMQVGFKLLAADVKIASRLVHRVLHGKSLSR